MSPSLLLALSVVSATVYVDDYTNVEETYQDAAIQRAAAAAGVGGEVLFTAGSTYTIRQELWQYEGQTWRTDGAGMATLRRADEVTTTLLEDAPAGSTTLHVADASLFPENSGISPIIGEGGMKEGERTFVRVDSAEGNTIELHKALRGSYQTGDTVVSTTRLINMATDGSLESLRIDGNAAGNHSFVSWSVHADVLINNKSDGATIRNLQMVDSQGNAIFISGDSVRVISSTIEGGNLAAVHIGNVVNLLWVDNHVVGTNQQAARGGHSEGAITVSLKNQGITILGSTFENIPTFAIGAAMPNTNSDFYVLGSTFVNNEGIFSAYTSRDRVGYLGLSMVENTFVDSGEIFLWGRDGEFISNVTLLNNTFENSGLSLENVSEVKAFRNEFDADSWKEFESTYFLRYSPADLDNDGDIDTTDLTGFYVNYTGDIGAEGGKTFLEGDTDGDGDVDTTDLTYAFQNFTGDLGGDPQPYSLEGPPESSFNTAPTPEPSSLILAALGALGCLAYRYRHRLRR